MIIARQLIVILLFFAILAGCASAPESIAPIGSAPITSQKSALNYQQVRELLHDQYIAWKGVPYKIGGDDKNGVDCSGFVQIAFKKALGMRLPRSTQLLLQSGQEISRKELSVGDLVFFKTGLAKHHVGIYMGKGQFIHASTSNGVMKSNLKSPYWSKHYWKSTRVLQI